MYHEISLPLVSETAYAENNVAAGILLQTRLVVLFLKEEVEQSSKLLQQLSGIFTEELCSLSDPTNLHGGNASFLRMSEALQSEDRIQQRLRDIGCALGMLEVAINPDNKTDNQYLPISIIEQLKLDEMKTSLAIKAKMSDEVIAMHEPRSPKIGEIDLF